jgi:hypothetical protein
MPEVNVYRDGKVHVRAEQCDHCLYSKDRLVDGGRARQLTAESRAVIGSSFVCHRSQVSDEPEAICAVWFERFGDEDPIMRLAQHMGIIEKVGEEHA